MRRSVSRHEIHTHDGVVMWARDWLRPLGWDVVGSRKNSGLKPGGSISISRGSHAVSVAYMLPAIVQILREQCINVMASIEGGHLKAIDAARDRGSPTVEEVVHD